MRRNTKTAFHPTEGAFAPRLRPRLPEISETRTMPIKDQLIEYFDSAWEAVANNYHNWLFALATAIFTFVVLRLANALFLRYAARMSERGKGEWFRDLEAMFRRTKTWILAIAAACAGSLPLGLSAEHMQFVRAAAVTVLLVQAALWAGALVSASIARVSERRRETDAAGATTLAALGFVGRMAIWSAAALLIVANLGIDVTAMIAGFGIGGIAVALAAQNILGDLFASASIVLDKPFVLGDFINVDNKMGTVEYIGLKTTRLRSLTGEQVVFSNADLLKSRIHNYKRMYQRRILFTIDVTYDTPVEKVSAIPGILREAVESCERVRFDRAHFARFSESALAFEVVYFVLAPEYNVYMDIQQEINLTILRRFTEEKIAFAFPSRTIYHG